ncbi:amidohydrolase family protein [Thalassotalea sp. PS06]|uniref:amidohydrolase family protein n=1 Tax=Thalassotalea sp. PS06 TaxID=2594005 RepID=UPI0011636B9E|nr:amidohydrolase family protein [Thalassotalea sp. PS06]QDP02615.1 amidohydrolase family protein [Thalassotalea sp. PS06]
MNKTLIASIVAAGVTVSAGAAAENIAIVGGKVHTMTSTGTLEKATILIEDNKITKVGKDITVSGEYRVIDATGKVVTPGLMGAFTSLGLVEVPSYGSGVDANAGKAAISAGLDASYAITPDTSLRDITRIEGFTSVASAVSQSATMFKGQGAIVTLGNDETPVTKARAFMVVDVSESGAHKAGGSRAALWVELRDALKQAEYAQNIRFTPQTEWHGMPVADVKALVPVVKGDTPLLVIAHRATDIRQVIALKEEFSSLNITLVGAAEGWRVADEIGAVGFSVILNPESNLPYSFQQNAATLANAGRLNEAGVNVAIGMNTHNIRLASQNAGNAVANGLPYQAGLASLTSSVAKIYGLEDTHGSLKAGMTADVVVWSGDPLEVMHAPTNVIINGEEVKLESRQTKLRDRYLSLESDKPVQYTRP